MDELVAWLRGVLDDDERVAKAATPGPWTASGDWSPSVEAGDDTVAAYKGFWEEDNGVDPECIKEADATHIARHDPAQVLADVAAKRAVLDAYTARAELASRGGLINRDPLGFAVRTLASAYRHRPGWKNDWE